MDSPHVVLHVVHPAKDAPALFAAGAPPLALDARVVLGFVAGAVLFGGEAAAEGAVGGARGRGGLGLRAAVDAAEEVFGVAVVVLAKVAAACEGGAGGAAWVGAAPGGLGGGGVCDGDTIGVEAGGGGGRVGAEGGAS